MIPICLYLVPAAEFASFDVRYSRGSGSPGGQSPNHSARKMVLLGTFGMLNDCWTRPKSSSACATTKRSWMSCSCQSVEVFDVGVFVIIGGGRGVGEGGTPSEISMKVSTKPQSAWPRNGGD